LVMSAAAMAALAIIATLVAKTTGGFFTAAV
jgi:hypothetical protein